jgi:hypothetical protein
MTARAVLLCGYAIFAASIVAVCALIFGGRR